MISGYFGLWITEPLQHVEGSINYGVRQALEVGLEFSHFRERELLIHWVVIFRPILVLHGVFL